MYDNNLAKDSHTVEWRQHRRLVPVPLPRSPIKKKKRQQQTNLSAWNYRLCWRSIRAREENGKWELHVIIIIIMKWWPNVSKSIEYYALVDIVRSSSHSGSFDIWQWANEEKQKEWNESKKKEKKFHEKRINRRIKIKRKIKIK